MPKGGSCCPTCPHAGEPNLLMNWHQGDETRHSTSASAWAGQWWSHPKPASRPRSTTGALYAGRKEIDGSAAASRHWVYLFPLQGLDAAFLDSCFRRSAF